MANHIKKIGKVKVVDDGTDVKFYVNNTTLVCTINHASGNFTFEALSIFDELNVAATTGYAEKFAVEGNSRMTGYLILNGGAGTYLQLPTLTSTQRDALTPVDGMAIFNSSTGKLEVRYGGTWNAQA